MSKIKMLFFIIIVLLITNGVAWFMVFSKGDRHEKPKQKSRMETFLRDQVGFTPDQMVRYEEVSKQNMENFRAHLDATRQRKETILKEVSAGGFSDSVIGHAARQLSSAQVNSDSIFLSNIRNIRNICTPEQVQQFDDGWHQQMRRNRKKPSR